MTIEEGELNRSSSQHCDYLTILTLYSFMWNSRLIDESLTSFSLKSSYFSTIQIWIPEAAVFSDNYKVHELVRMKIRSVRMKLAACVSYLKRGSPQQLGESGANISILDHIRSNYL